MDDLEAKIREEYETHLRKAASEVTSTFRTRLVPTALRVLVGEAVISGRGSSVKRTSTAMATRGRRRWISLVLVDDMGAVVGG